MIIPAFALGRVEELLYWINRLEEQQRDSELPVYVDSPMAAAVLAEYRKRARRARSGDRRRWPRPAAGTPARAAAVRVLHGAS